ncbi:MAG: DUF5677 domain-containing protein [Candidatus Bathyarchaeota archaeon]|nr:DUF5677 domain-containing protein [Candidatus Bathyarchaeota archaeon]
MASQHKFGSDETTRLFFNFYNSQLGLLENLYQYQFTNLKHLDNTRLGTLYPLLFSIHHTGTSISLLSMQLHLNECYMLARSFLERLINYTFLLSCDEEEYSRYLAYTRQKAYRVLDRNFTAGDLKVSLRWSGSIDLEKESELKKAVDIFTSDTGKPKTRWTSRNLSGMLESIARKGEIEIGYLMFAILGIYDDASEALHGTLYGSTFHIGTFIGKKPSSKNELKKTWNEQLSELFLMLGSCIHTLIRAFHKVATIESILSESTKNLKEIGKVIKQTGSGYRGTTS